MSLLPDGTFVCECGVTRPLLSPTDTGIPAGEVVCTADCQSLGKPDTEEDFTVAADGLRHHRLTEADVETADAYYREVDAPAAAAKKPAPAPAPSPAPAA